VRRSRLTDLDFEPLASSRRQRRPLRRPLALGVAALLCGLLAVAMARSPEPVGQPSGVDVAGGSDRTRGTAPMDIAIPELAASDASVKGGDEDWQPGILLDASLPLPIHHDQQSGELLILQEMARLMPDPEDAFETVTVRSGDSLAAIFGRAGLSPLEVHRVVNSDERVKALRRIYPGDEIQFRVSDDKQLQALRYKLDNTRTLQVDRVDDDFRVDIHEEVLETRVLHSTGTIERSLFLSGRRAGLSQRQIMQFMSVFEWQVDFNREIREGDTFSVMYEAHYLNGERVEEGRILAAKLTNRNRRLNALHYELPDGTRGYFGPDGQNMRKAFMRRPIQNARISSGFNRNRKHPVLGVHRPHLGTDFAAPTGTPIMASGSGRVVHRGRKGGYGNTVIIQHNNRYRTLYAHMSRYANGIREGSRVEQGQVIGYVGRSGLATGPHLHYEFMVNGSHRNPMTVELPSGDPVPQEHMSDFRAMTAGLLAQLQDAARTELAMGGDD